MVKIRQAVLSDVPEMTEVIAQAFTDDPTWYWAIPDLVARKKLWLLLVENAIRYPYVLTTGELEAVSVWIPPGGSELGPEDEARFPDIVEELVGERANEVMELFELFEEHHPHHQPHYYLSILATRNSARGQGSGMALLRACLDRFDAEKIPVYLESSNPVNDQRYRSVGFVPVTTYHAPGNGPVVTGMWREPS